MRIFNIKAGRELLAKFLRVSWKKSNNFEFRLIIYLFDKCNLLNTELWIRKQGNSLSRWICLVSSRFWNPRNTFYFILLFSVYNNRIGTVWLFHRLQIHVSSSLFKFMNTDHFIIIRCKDRAIWILYAKRFSDKWEGDIY